MNNHAVSPAATSTWATLWSGTGRVLRRSTMPLAWAVTLGVCAVSAFAVRDVVFPALEPSASPSLWQPQPGDSTSTVAGVGSTADRIDDSTAPSTTEPIVESGPETTTAVSSSSDAASTTVRRSSGGAGSAPTVTTAKPRSPSSPSSSAPTTSIDDEQSPSTSAGAATTTSDPEPSTTVTETTDPATTDTLPGDPGGGTSGSGLGGRIDDSHP